MSIFKKFRINNLSSIYSYITGRNNNNQPIIITPNATSTKSGESISNEQAIVESTIFTCVNIIAQGIAQLPIISESNKRLFSKPNSYQTRYEFVYAIVHSLLCYGNAYIRIDRGKETNNGRVLVLLNADLVTVEANGFGYPIYKYDDEKEPIKYDDIVHIKDINTFGVVGLSRVLLCSERIGCLKASDRQIAENFNNGIDIKYSINIDKQAITEEQKTKLANKIKELFGRGGEIGTDGKPTGQRRGGAIILPQGKVEQFKGMTVADTDLREIRAMLIREISAIFRVPSYMVGTDGDQKYSNVRQNQTSLYRDTYLPIITSIEQAFENKNIFIKFDVNELLKGDFESQMRVITQGVQSGVITPNEARTYLGYNVIDDEDADRIQSSKTLGVADQRGSEQEPNAMNTDVTNNDGREENSRNEE